MPNEIASIDPTALATVTGGKHNSSNGSSSLLNDLSSLATQIKDLSAKTSGFTPSQMLLLGLLAMQRNQANVVYVRRW